MNDTGRFPTRHYAWRPRGVEFDAAAKTPLVLPPGILHRFILGRDAKPVAMTNGDIEERLRDPFASLLLRRGIFPVTLTELLGALNKVNASANGVPSQRTFIVAEGGQIQWTTATSQLDRGVRLVVARGAAAGLPSLFVSTSTEIDSPSTFLQVLTWDAAAGVFQWYDRRAGTWIWAGNSFDSLADDSRGQGPFDSHVNGALNMKELKVPWIHWHSQSASISPEAFPPGDPFVMSELYLNRSGAEDLERQIVRPSISRWNTARFASRTSAGELQRLPEFFRQVLSTTSVNLAASPEASTQLKAGSRFVLPLTLFVDIDGLINELDILEDLDPIEIDGGAYLAALAEFDVALRDDQSGFVQSGDAFFACPVPERAFEDQVVLHALLSKDDESKQVLSDRLAACMLMVDFSNPVFSARREVLLKYVPATAPLGNPRALEEAFVSAVTNAAMPAGSPEAEFLANWTIPDNQWRKVFAQRIRDYMTAATLAVTHHFNDVFRLIDSRRREFRRRPLAEFSLTVPSSNIPRDAPFVEIGIDARVRDKP